MSDRKQDQRDYDDLLNERQATNDLDYELSGDSENDFEPKKRGKFRKGCAFFLAIVMLGFVALVAIGYLPDDYFLEYEEYSFDEFSPDLRMDLSPIFASEQDWHKGFERLEVLVSDLEGKKDILARDGR